MHSGPLAGLFDDAVFPPATIDGKIVMLPHTADVTNVLWYNKQILADAGITPPTTWDELLAACDTLNAKGIIPMASGNKDLWAAGNFLSHMASRVVGEDVYAATLGGSGTFDTPEWQKAFGYIADLTAHKCVNDSVNAINDNEGMQLFFQGKAAMHPIGSWLVSLGHRRGADARLTTSSTGPPCPTVPRATRTASSGSRRATSSTPGAPTSRCRRLPGTRQQSRRQCPGIPGRGGDTHRQVGIAGQAIDSRSARLAELLNNAPAVVLPPDTGYDLKMANALFAAEAAVLGGQMSPADALAGIDQQLGR